MQKYNVLAQLDLYNNPKIVDQKMFTYIIRNKQTTEGIMWFGNYFQSLINWLSVKDFTFDQIWELFKTTDVIQLDVAIEDTELFNPQCSNYYG